MERITNKNIESRFKTLAEIVFKYLGINLSYQCAYGNHYSIYDDNKSLWPDSYCAIGKREFYEKMGIILNTLYRLTNCPNLYPHAKYEEHIELMNCNWDLIEKKNEETINKIEDSRLDQP